MIKLDRKFSPAPFSTIVLGTDYIPLAAEQQQEDPHGGH